MWARMWESVIIVQNQKGFVERKVSGEESLRTTRVLQQILSARVIKFGTKCHEDTSCQNIDCNAWEGQTISVFHQELKPCSGFFFGAVVVHKGPKSPSAETVTGYKPFGFVPSLFIKVTRQTHSQISLRICYGRLEECRPTKESSCLKKYIRFRYLSYTFWEYCNYIPDIGSELQQVCVNFNNPLVVTQRQAVTEQFWEDTFISVVRTTVETQHRVTQTQQSSYCNNYAACFRYCSHRCGKMSKKRAKKLSKL